MAIDSKQVTACAIRMIKWKRQYETLLTKPGRVWAPSEITDIDYAFRKYRRAERDLTKVITEGCFESPKP